MGEVAFWERMLEAEERILEGEGEDKEGEESPTTELGRWERKMGFGEEDGEEFDQVEVELVPVVELDVPDEFDVSGHVVVSDHAAVPLATELHPDVSSDEVARERKMRRRDVGGGGIT